MNTTQQQQTYTNAGLGRLYTAIKEQAEHEFLEALRRDYPGLRQDQVDAVMRHYQSTVELSEQRLCAETEAGQGEEEHNDRSLQKG